MLRIGIDGANLAMPQGTGVATYGFTLAATLMAGGHQVEALFGLDAGGYAATREAQFFDRLARPAPEPRNRLRRKLATLKMWGGIDAEEVWIDGTVDNRAFADRLPAFDRVVTSPWLFERAQRFFSTTGRFVEVRVQRPPTIMHWTYPMPVRLAGTRNIYTVHDLVPLRLPHTTLDAKQRHHRLLSRCFQEADHVVTVSETSRQDLLHDFNLAPDRVTNTFQVSPLRVAEVEADRAGPAEVERLFELPERGYFLFYGAIEPKKNVGRLIEAYLSLGTDTPLVLVGGRSWQSEAELVLLPRGRDDPRFDAFSRRVIRLDYLPRHLLVHLIRSARAVTFPSLYEGFGLPAHEAMLLGTPVLAGRAGALPEIVGEGGLLVDPYDVGAIANGLRRLDTEPELRQRLSAEGLVQAQRFGVARYRAALEAVYGRLLAGGSQDSLGSGEQE